MKPPHSTAGWFGRAAAGLLLGLLFAVGVSGLFRATVAAGSPFFSTKGQFVMWLISPVWALILSLCFLFRSTARAWGWLAAANLLLWGIVALLGGLGR